MSRRTQAILSAIRPTARVAYLGPAALTVGAGAVPLVVTTARSDPSTSAPLLVACLLGGAALGWAAEDPAAELLAALPVPSPTRTILRLSAIALIAASVLGILALVVAIGPGLPEDRSARVAEAAASGAIATATGLTAARRGERGIGPVGVTAGVFGTGFIAALAYRWPLWLPTFGPGPIHHRWWIVTLSAIAIAVHVGRDPGRR
jgi:hypothetical protein